MANLDKCFVFFQSSVLLRSRSFFSSISDCSALTGDEWSRWQDVHSLYDAGKFDEAFQALSAQPSGDDPSYFYNLGLSLTASEKMARLLGILKRRTA